MKTLEISKIDDLEEIITKAEEKFGSNKRFVLAQWPNGTMRLIMDGTCNDSESFGGL